MNVAGANIRAIRTQLGLSLRALARATGLEVSTLSMIETGKQNLTEEKAKRIADVLHVSVGMLFSEPGLVEMAMLRMRKLPVLTNEQLHAWTGPEDFEEADEQEYLHTAIKVGSRHMFAVRIVDRANVCCARETWRSSMQSEFRRLAMLCWPRTKPGKLQSADFARISRWIHPRSMSFLMIECSQKSGRASHYCWPCAAF